MLSVYPATLGGDALEVSGLEVSGFSDQLGVQAGNTRWYTRVRVRVRIAGGTSIVVLDISLPIRCVWGEVEGIWVAFARDESNYKSRPVLWTDDGFVMPAGGMGKFKYLGGEVVEDSDELLKKMVDHSEQKKQESESGTLGGRGKVKVEEVEDASAERSGPNKRRKVPPKKGAAPRAPHAHPQPPQPVPPIVIDTQDLAGRVGPEVRKAMGAVTASLEGLRNELKVRLLHVRYVYKRIHSNNLQ